MKRYIISVLLALTLIGCAVKQHDTLGDELSQFRATRSFYNKALLRCNYLVTEKYHSRLYGFTPLEGAERREVEAAARADYATCATNYNRKATALWEAQSPEVHAFYKKSSAELHQEFERVKAEAQR
ncbi:MULTISPECIES: hypothetical protein [Enterobacter]|uniref:hypothetical protein n=1 Tax=Enterobacter TaxID=547 RepID=UPI0028ED023A|nr:hypothetical protein [Enterobacter cloacae]HDR2753277.1 hypothetical protein [Enterobacter asburiae]WNT38406.1 hypothetical protein RRL13_10000 [Enterobacter cloacae]HDR2790703.1 hypothetical protein [Enterobacter asburiae]HDR2791476.1 hypothetical protein [Enterobacter asburiae]HDR2791716.1 hypothetical protein [Enterobacter asburiae]